MGGLSLSDNVLDPE